MRRLSLVATVIGLGCGCVLLAGEIIARGAHLPGRRLQDPVLFRCPGLRETRWHVQWHPGYLWTLKPSTELRTWSDAPGTALSTDEYGFRRTAWPEVRAPRGGEIRWVFIGDSMVFSGQARTGWSFPDAALNHVAAHYPRLGMIAFNLGVPAHTSFQTLRVLKGEFHRVRPDIVVYWGASNDNAPASGYSDRIFGLLYGGPMHTVRRLLDRSAFIRWTRTLHGPQTEPAPTRPPKGSVDYPRRVNQDQYEHNVREMARFAASRGARFLALTRQHAKFDRGLDLYNARLRLLQEQGFLALIDIRDIYPTAVRDSLMSRYPEDKVHFNEKGYRLVAERTAGYIIEEGWLDSLCPG